MEHTHDAQKPASHSAAESVKQTSADSGAAVVQRAENRTGLPDNLKAGIENLSGYSMNDVKVHYNSSQPARLQAHAYAQGTDIHLAPGQEKQLPHEAWHVVQQKQGRVKATRQMKGKVNLNDDTGLEQEADVMGQKAMNNGHTAVQRVKATGSVPAGNVLQRAALVKNRLNVVGEEHGESDARRDMEKAFTTKETGSQSYWREGEFKRGDGEFGDPPGMRFLQFWGFAEAAGLSNHLTNGNCNLGTVKTQLEAARGQLYGTEVIKGIDMLSNHILFKSWKRELRYIRPDEAYGDDARAIGTLLEQHGTPNDRPVLDMVNNLQPMVTAYYQNLHPEWRDEDSDLSDEDEPLVGNDEDDGIVLQPQGINTEQDLDRELNLILVHALGLLQALQAYDALKARYNITGSQNIIERRSRGMDAAANGDYNTPGVWKIGDAHRRDMQGFNTRKRYNLLSRNEFNTLLIGFERKAGALIGAVAGGAIGFAVGGPLGAFLGAAAGGFLGFIIGHFVGKKRKGIRNVQTGLPVQQNT